MGTKVNPGIHDCYDRLASDEPFFVLRANDELAPELVIEWAMQYRGSKKAAQGGVLTEPQILKMTEALALAGEMIQWRREKEGRA